MNQLKLEPLVTAPTAAGGQLYFDSTAGKLMLSEGGAFVEVLTSGAGGSGITGSGTTGTLPKFTGATSIGDSILSESSGGSALRVTSKDTAVELLESDQILPAGLRRMIGASGHLYIDMNTAGAGDFSTATTPFLITAGGNVGINNVDPTSALDVGGKTTTVDLQVTGGTPTLGYVLTSDATGNATWGANPGSTGWQLAGNDHVAGDFLGNVAGNTVPLEFRGN